MNSNKWSFSIRWKFLAAFIGSLAITALVLLLGNIIAARLLLTGIPAFTTPMHWIINNIGSTAIMIIFGTIVFTASFYWLSLPMVRYIHRIEQVVQELASGRMLSNVSSKSSHELGALAQQVNEAVAELNSYMLEIKQGLQEIATGNFEHTIPVRELSELGEVADHINKMSAQLSRSIEEERNAEKTKNDLITGVSHDLRTPLTSILGFLELIEKDRYQDEVELRYYVNIAYEKSLRLKKLIDDLFEYTRINNGMPLMLAELDLVDFMQQLADEFVPVLEEADMTCRIHAPDEPVKVIVDGDQLVRAFSNLMSNAVRYGHVGKIIDIYLEADADRATVKVTNYGPPIPVRDIPYVFDRFYRVDSSRQVTTGGTGLGLAITKSIIQALGGQITVYSNQRHTTFETSLPLKR
ncbi:sensor histidine kinase [Paenibacillus marinisediminis]